MKKIKTDITLKENSHLLKVPLTIKTYEKKDETDKIKITLKYKEKKYIGEGTDYTWTDAFADLQKKLPDEVEIACCMTCKHGNMCPYGDIPRELYCTKNIIINGKEDMIKLFEDDNFYIDNKVLADHYCKNFASQDMNYPTYNDYKYYKFKQ